MDGTETQTSQDIYAADVLVTLMEQIPAVTFMAVLGEGENDVLR